MSPLRTDLEIARASAAKLEDFLANMMAALPVEAPQGMTLPAPNAQAFQDALDVSDPGDTILVNPVLYTGNFNFPAKADGPPVKIRCLADAPESMGRIRPDVSFIPTFESVSGPTWLCEAGNNYDISGARILMHEGQDEAIILDGARNFSLDRVVIQGKANNKRGIRGNGSNISLTRSHISNVFRIGNADTAAFGAWMGLGPYTIVGNFLESAGINVLFGGDDQGSPDTIPSDILVEGNVISKRPEWRSVARTVKNLFEIKNGKRIVVRRNLFDGNWTDGQNGYSILFSTMNQDGGAPWSVIEDVLFTLNIGKNLERGFNIHGRGWTHPTQQSKGIVITKNAFDIANEAMQVAGELADLTVTQNVFDNGYHFLSMYKGGVRNQDGSMREGEYAIRKLVYEGNVVRHNEYGLFAEGGIGEAGLKACTREYTWGGNALANWERYLFDYPTGTLRATPEQFAVAKAALLAEIGTIA